MNKGQFISMKERIERHIEPCPSSGCWLFIGKNDKDGYGVFRNRTGKGGDFKAHRVSWEVYVGKIPRGMEIAHHCDVRSCVNPAHMYVATHSQNIADRTNRNRLPTKEKCSWSKVTTEDVIAIRNSSESPIFWAKKLGISKAHVYRLKNGECWK